MDVMHTMYGCDIDVFVDNIKQSFTYNAGGVGMVIAGLMSDAQEQAEHEDLEGVRYTLNRAKHLLFRALSGDLDFNRLTIEKVEE
jgi:hypothetical protein